MNKQPAQFRIKAGHKPLFVLLAVAIALLLAGNFIFISLRDAARDEQKAQISAIGKLKVDQIEDWLDDRHSDIQTLSGDSYFARDFDRWQRSGLRNRELRERIMRRLDAFIDSHHYHSISLYDEHGKFVLRAGKAILNEEDMTEYAHQTMLTSRTVFIDLHRHDDVNFPVGLGFVSPINMPDHAAGAIYFSEDPARYLFPLIETWPVESMTAETQLVRAEGERVVFLSRLRKREEAPLLFSLPLSTPQLGAAQAVLGKSGLLEHAHDYSGDAVLSFAMAINGTPWVLVSKVSEEEAYALVNRLELLAVMSSITIFSFAGLWFLQWRRREQLATDTAVLEAHLRADVLQMEAEKRFRMVFEYTALPMVRNSLAGEFIEVNDAWCNMFGYSREDVARQHLTWQQITHPDDIEADAAQVKKMLAGEIAHFKLDKRYLHKDGKVLWGAVQVSLVRDEKGAPDYMISAIQDITESKRTEQQVSFMAYHDKLTGLPNRALFFDRLSQAMSQARRGRKHVALLFLDLDGFKPINDIYGHEAGDAVLKMVAQRLLACVRAVDTVARLGGDEFAVITGDLDNPAEVERIAEQILQAFAQQMALPEGEECRVGVSIGISIYPDNGDEMDSLLAAADEAMYESKRKGKNTYSYFGGVPIAEGNSDSWIVFDSAHHVGVVEIDEQHRELVRMVNRLNGAIKNKEGDAITMRLYDELLKYTAFHFATEHRLMEQSGYPDLAQHDLEHTHLVDEAVHFKTRLTQGGDLLALQSIKDWLLNHIRYSDKPLANYLLEHGVH
jgi:diguanylate cyclase (GGDEF)-like protein/hemerythrin-like metal-binding protein/PAS domain S-box-containing protein